MLWLTITAVCCGRLCTSTLDELSEVLGRIRYLASFAPKISIPVLAILIIYSRNAKAEIHASVQRCFTPCHTGSVQVFLFMERGEEGL
jgi:hypothetical protein